MLASSASRAEPPIRNVLCLHGAIPQLGLAVTQNTRLGCDSLQACTRQRAETRPRQPVSKPPRLSGKTSFHMPSQLSSATVHVLHLLPPPSTPFVASYTRHHVGQVYMRPQPLCCGQPHLRHQCRGHQLPGVRHVLRCHGLHGCHGVQR